MAEFQIKLKYKNGHIKSLDGIRGLAIILVIIHHLYAFYPFDKLANFGWSGVDMFFVLSGFLITGILYDTRHNKNYYKTFIVRRALRIFPLYYLVITLTFLFAKLSAITNFKYLLDNQLYFWTYTQNFLIAKDSFSNDRFSGILSHLWSLAIEEQFYIFWPLVILLFNVKNILIVCSILIMSALIIRNVYPQYPFSYVFTFAKTDSLTIGAALAILIREQKEILEKIVSFALPFLSIFFIVFIIAENNYLYASNPLYARYAFTLLDLFYGCILIICFAKGRVGVVFNKIFSNKLLVLFGKYSYGIYVYHRIIYMLVSSPLKYRLVTYISNNSLLQFSVSSVCLFSTLFLSFISYRFFEKRFLHLKNKITGNNIDKNNFKNFSL